jgi:hypothetical protein
LFDDGSCCYVSGCIDPLANNFDQSACISDSSCTYNTGCTDSLAYNYDSLALVDDGSCLYCNSTDSIVYSYTGSIQQYIVPAGITSLNIKASGANGGSGGNGAFPGGFGASMSGDFSVNSGDTLFIVVGQSGCDTAIDGSGLTSSGGGGGASGVNSGGVPLIVAGGGGGVDSGDPNFSGRHAVISNLGVAGNNNTANIVLGDDGIGYVYSSVNFAYGGRGWNSGAYWTNGSWGQDGISPQTTATLGTYGIGGGGGSVGAGYCNCGGGGGGYSGGGSGNINSSGGGGGSYNIGTNQNNIPAFNNGSGYVIISYNSVSCDGCTDPLALNYDSLALFDDGSCCYVSGCIDPIASNYDALACIDDGSCIYVLGCTDSLAANYDSLATQDDGSCLYCNVSDSVVIFMNGSPSGLYTLTSNVTIPSGVTNITLDLRAGGDLNSQSEFFNVYFNGVQYGGDWSTGIQDCNLYDLSLDDTITSLLNIGQNLIEVTQSSAVDDLGNCTPSSALIVEFTFDYSTQGGCNGCTDPFALNYDSLALFDDGSCTYSGLSLDPVSDSLCLGDTVVITWTGGNPADNIQLGTVNNTLWQTGFTIAIIPNTGSYTWVVSNFPPGPGDLYQFYIQDTPNQNSWDYGSVFAICPIYGCVDPLATNFDPQATLDNGSCFYSNNIVVIDSINAVNPILCYGNLGDIEVFVDNDTSSLGSGPNLVTYQLKAFKVASSSTFSYLSSSQTNASSVVASGLDQSTYYLLVVDSVAFNSTYNPFAQYFSNSYFINTVLNDPSVYDFDSIYLSEPAELVDTISTVSSNLCYGDCDASELITISGGVMPYSLNGINLLQSDTLLSNLCAGNYTVNITDANGCQVSNLFSFITIGEPPLAQSYDSVYTCNPYLWNGNLH